MQQCASCGSLGEEALKICGFLILVVLYVGALTLLIVRNPERQKNHSVLLRIITNYLTELLMIKDLNLEWPPSINEFFTKFTFIGNAGTQVIKVNCFLQGQDSTISLSTYVIGMVLFCSTPFIFGMLSILPFLLLRCVWPKKYKDSYLRDFIATNSTFIFLIYPTITSYAFGMFNCSEIDGVNYLTVDFDIVCWSKDHISLILIYTLPILVLWVLGFPILIFISLYRNRNNLSSENTLVKYGMYYIGFTDKSFYWQIIVVNIRRVLYVAIAVSVQNYNKNMFVYFIFFVMYIYMSMTRCF
mmetsp:Transcript_15841/g.15261  ORF Transcript_15841/g.15261 Transcript_15841/m.15261 type:complete len:300 (+) Transcript_15841:148-1047(+)